MLYFGFQESSSENRNGLSAPRGPTSGRQQQFQDRRLSMTLQWEGWAGEIPSCLVCGTVASKCSLGTPTCWGSFQPWSAMPTGSKCSKCSGIKSPQNSLPGLLWEEGKTPQGRASSCCWRLCHSRNHMSSAWHQPSETFIPQQLGRKEL